MVVYYVEDALLTDTRGLSQKAGHGAKLRVFRPQHWQIQLPKQHPKRLKLYWECSPFPVGVHYGKGTPRSSSPVAASRAGILMFLKIFIDLIKQPCTHWHHLTLKELVLCCFKWALDTASPVSYYVCCKYPIKIFEFSGVQGGYQPCSSIYRRGAGVAVHVCQYLKSYTYIFKFLISFFCLAVCRETTDGISPSDFNALRYHSLLTGPQGTWGRDSYKENATWGTVYHLGP